MPIVGDASGARPNFARMRPFLSPNARLALPSLDRPIVARTLPFSSPTASPAAPSEEARTASDLPVGCQQREERVVVGGQADAQAHLPLIVDDLEFPGLDDSLLHALVPRGRARDRGRIVPRAGCQLKQPYRADRRAPGMR